MKVEEPNQDRSIIRAFGRTGVGVNNFLAWNFKVNGLRQEQQELPSLPCAAMKVEEPNQDRSNARDGV
jgi:hypothetical protein